MEDFGLLPQPPVWAMEAGLPPPRADETFIAYVERLGMQAEPLLAGLTAQTVPLANSRLAYRLSRTMRSAFDRYIEERGSEWLTPERRRHLSEFS